MCIGLFLQVKLLIIVHLASSEEYKHSAHWRLSTWNISQYSEATIILHEETTGVFNFKVVWMLICICLCLRKAVVWKFWVSFIVCRQSLLPSPAFSHRAMVSFLHIFSQSKGSIWCTSLTICSSSLLCIHFWLHYCCWGQGGCMDFAGGNIPIKTMRHEKL